MKALQKLFSVFLVFLLVFPASVEFAHIFAGHEHHFCNHNSDSHFHQNNQECSLFHFQHNSYSSPEFVSFQPLAVTYEERKDELHYQFLSTEVSLHFFRRGPPENVFSC